MCVVVGIHICPQINEEKFLQIFLCDCTELLFSGFFFYLFIIDVICVSPVLNSTASDGFISTAYHIYSANVKNSFYFILCFFSNESTTQPKIYHLIFLLLFWKHLFKFFVFFSHCRCFVLLRTDVFIVFLRHNLCFAVHVPYIILLCVRLDLLLLLFFCILGWFHYVYLFYHSFNK